MKKIFTIISLLILLSSCSPELHVIGLSMRKFNTSQNKYSKKHSYVGDKKKFVHK